MTDAPTAAMTNEKKTTAPENYINRVTFGARLKQYARSPLSLILMILVMLAALFSVGMLIFIIAYILINGVPHLTAEQFDWNYTTGKRQHDAGDDKHPNHDRTDSCDRRSDRRFRGGVPR